MAKQTNIDKRGIAKTLYTSGNYTQEEIAVKVGTTRQTVARWTKSESWDEIKAGMTITPAKILAGFNRQIMEINDNILQREKGHRYATTEEADTIAKLSAAIKKIETDIGISDTVGVGIKFTNWLRGIDVELAKEVDAAWDSFLKEMINTKR